MWKNILNVGKNSEDKITVIIKVLMRVSAGYLQDVLPGLLGCCWPLLSVSREQAVWIAYLAFLPSASVGFRWWEETAEERKREGERPHWLLGSVSLGDSDAGWMSFWKAKASIKQPTACHLIATLSLFPLLETEKVSAPQFPQDEALSIFGFTSEA